MDGLAIITFCPEELKSFSTSFLFRFYNDPAKWIFFVVVHGFLPSLNGCPHGGERRGGDLEKGKGAKGEAPNTNVNFISSD